MSFFSGRGQLPQQTWTVPNSQLFSMLGTPLPGKFLFPPFFLIFSIHLPRFRERFEFPTLGSLPCQTEGPPNSPVIYMCGNSLGLKPKQADEYMREQLGANLTPDDDQPPLLLRQLGPESCLHAFHRQDPGSAGGESSVTTLIQSCFASNFSLAQDQPGKRVTASLVGANSPKEVLHSFNNSLVHA